MSEHHEPRELIPLHALEAEMSSLGSMLLSETAAATLSRMLEPEMFYRPAHRILFKALREMSDKGTAIEFLTLVDALGSRLEDCGGEDYLVKICEYTPSPANCEFYGLIVKEKWARRQLRENGAKLAQMALDSEKSTEEVRAFASAIAAESLTVGSKSPWVHISDIQLKDTEQGAPTGWDALDAMITCKGFPLGQMTIVRAFQKSGKTSFLLTSAASALKGFESVGYATFADLNDEQALRRLLKGETGWNKIPEQQSLGFVEDALRTMRENWDLRIYDASVLDDEGTVEAFCSWVKAEHARKPFDRLYVDYAQEISSSDKRARNMIDTLQIVSSKLNRLAAQTGLPLIVGSQVTEGFQGSRTKTKYGRGLEEKGGWILTLEMLENKRVKVESTFCRFGPSGVAVEMAWNDKRVRMEEVPSPLREFA